MLPLLLLLLLILLVLKSSTSTGANNEAILRIRWLLPGGFRRFVFLLFDFQGFLHRFHFEDNDGGRLDGRRRFTFGDDHRSRASHRGSFSKAGGPARRPRQRAVPRSPAVHQNWWTAVRASALLVGCERRAERLLSRPVRRRGKGGTQRLVRFRDVAWGRGNRRRARRSVPHPTVLIPRRRGGGMSTGRGASQSSRSRSGRSGLCSLLASQPLSQGPSVTPHDGRPGVVVSHSAEGRAPVVAQHHDRTPSAAVLQKFGVVAR